ncbi:MAG: threonine aldolase [Actinomycetes bacterium]|jgi:threonine aldolase|nr:threonine aldolase [Actinomycetes bacterium]
MRAFGSDNYSGAHPAVLAALQQVNADHVVAYGDDPYTASAVETLQKHLGCDTHIRFAFNGTGANITGLSTLLRPWEAVVCADTAHIHTDEGGAAEHIASMKLLTIPTDDGKLTPAALAPVLDHYIGFEHARQPRVVSITNLTELGTLYMPAEIRALADYVHSRDLYLHCDGARLANAAAAAGVTLADISGNAGIDVMTLGGTKNAMLFGEAVVFFGAAAETARDISFYVRKESAQLASKMRYLAAQFSAMYAGDLWLECAAHANAMAHRLATGLRAAGADFAYSPDGNEVFALLPHAVVAPLQERFHFYTWEERADDIDVVRWVCSWDTTADEVDELLAAIVAVL